MPRKRRRTPYCSIKVISSELAQDVYLSEPPNQHIIRKAEAELALTQDRCHRGQGTRAIVLFHGKSLNAVMVLLETGGSGRVETNMAEEAMFYVIQDSENEKLEFKLLGADSPAHLLSNGDCSVNPPGATYSRKNLSRTVNAKLIAMVPPLKGS